MQTQEALKERLHLIESANCFVIDKKDKTIAIQRKIYPESDEKKFTLCSGSILNGEINRLAMARILYDEIGMHVFSKKDLIDNLKFVGKVKTDFDKENNAQKENEKYCTTFYAIDVTDEYDVFENKYRDFKIAWAKYSEIKKAIRASMFGFTYTKENAEAFEKMFKNVDQMIEGKGYNISLEEYERDWL